jgi:hypothetical protein
MCNIRRMIRFGYDIREGVRHVHGSADALLLTKVSVAGNLKHIAIVVSMA